MSGDERHVRGVAKSDAVVVPRKHGPHAGKGALHLADPVLRDGHERANHVPALGLRDAYGEGVPVQGAVPGKLVRVRDDDGDAAGPDGLGQPRRHPPAPLGREAAGVARRTD